MFTWLFKKILGSKHQRELRKLHPIVKQINDIEKTYQSDAGVEFLRNKTNQWKKHLSRYLPIKNFPSLRALENSSIVELEAIAKQLQEPIESLSDEFPNLPKKIEANPESILEAKSELTKLEDHFFAKRADYLKKILPEAFAVVKNTARSLVGQSFTVCDYDITWDMVHFDVQLIGGITLYHNRIAEMQTGEGKTLVSTLPIYLNALTGLGVHVVTVNDYLARRDAQWMGILFEKLGLSIGCLQNQMSHDDRKSQYQCDITYGTNSEFGFDYLRDNGIATSVEEQVQRGHYFAIIDEVDSILIDEARTPLIISGPAVVSDDNQTYLRYKNPIQQLLNKQKDFSNQLIKQAKQALAETKLNEAGNLLLQVKFSQPRNSEFLKLMEDPSNRKLIEKTELKLYEDNQKTQLFALKEELYFTIDEKSHTADIMEKGRKFLSPDDPDSFVLLDIAQHFGEIDSDLQLNESARNKQKEEIQLKLNQQSEKIHTISQLLKAYCLYEKDIHYIVNEGKVVIVDENTGREMPGRRWSDGLHQAVEAKENVKIDAENQTYATITIQNYFRLYQKLAGMTGTAETEASEFHDIYKLDVLPIPTNRPVMRIDYNDQVFKTQREKLAAIISTIKKVHQTAQPLLIGTASIDASEQVAKLLKKDKIPHSVLNAKNHLQEAEIISRAGQRGVVTVSTNMAGRGTDIKLGEGVKELGGLFVIGTERYESRRIDRQLRGRCARQGDPGCSQSFLSFEDDLMRNFCSSRTLN